MKKSITAVLAALFIISPALAWPGNNERIDSIYPVRGFCIGAPRPDCCVFCNEGIKGGDLSLANARERRYSGRGYSEVQEQFNPGNERQIPWYGSNRMVGQQPVPRHILRPEKRRRQQYTCELFQSLVRRNAQTC